MYSKLFLVLLAWISIFQSGSGYSQPVIQFVSEVDNITWKTLHEPEDFSDECRDVTEAEQVSWQGIFPRIIRMIDTERIVELSRWAIEETKGFELEFTEIPRMEIHQCQDQDIVYKVRLATLPSHVPIVYRFLDVYILGKEYMSLFLPNEFVFTIRGFVLE